MTMYSFCREYRKEMFYLFFNKGHISFNALS
jgi:hypothetical protein